MGPEATGVWGLKLLVYEGLSYHERESERERERASEREIERASERAREREREREQNKASKLSTCVPIKQRIKQVK